MPGIHFGLAKAYKAQGQNGKAMDAALRSVELDPSFAEAHYLLGQLYRDRNDAERARQEFETFRTLKYGAPPSR